MLKSRFSIACLLPIFFVGCASIPQAPIPMASGKLAEPGVRIGVVATPVPKVDTFFPGADCLLCIAFASAANSALTKHTQSLSVDDLRSIKQEVIVLLQKRGLKVIAIDEDLKIADLPKSRLEGPNVARKDFMSLSQRYQVDKLVVIDFNGAGMWRTYSAYFPTSDPKAFFSGAGYVVNLRDNTLDWYEPFKIFRAAEGTWDEPPSYPGLTNAYFQAIEAGRDVFKRPFLK